MPPATADAPQDATTAAAVDAALPAYDAPVVRSCLTLLASARATPTQAATLRVLGHLLGRSDSVLQHSGAGMGAPPRPAGLPSTVHNNALHRRAAHHADHTASGAIALRCTR
jgi:hypothetical protein